MSKALQSQATRADILSAAVRLFANHGYAATSVQQIVDAASVSKPALYYHFVDKAALFQAVVDTAHDERLRIMTEASRQKGPLRDRLGEILVGMFDFLKRNRELMRIAFGTTLAAPGELPEGLRYREKCERNFEFIHSVMREGLDAGELERHFNSRELAYSFYGLMNAYMVSHLLMPDCVLNADTAERIVDLFVSGAGVEKRKFEKASMI
jgi:AcrR family transcriptional regulator